MQPLKDGTYFNMGAALDEYYAGAKDCLLWLREIGAIKSNEYPALYRQLHLRYLEAAAERRLDAKR
jgi:hypothetical protein